jgi:predicted permease
MMSAIGGLAGIGLGMAMLKGLMARMPFTLPSETEVSLNLPVLLFTLGATTLAGILFGCAPAWQATRVDPNESLKEGGRAGMSGSKHRLRRILVVGEFGLALTLLATAGLALHSLWNVSQVDLGVRKDHLLTFYLPVSEKRFAKAEEIAPYYQQILEKVQAVPGVLNATVANGVPLQGVGFGMYFSIAGQPVADPSMRPSAAFQMVTPEYYRTYGIRVVSGRSFTSQDSASSERVAMVNENFVRRYLPGVDPLTQSVEVEQLVPGAYHPGPALEWRIVGVFHNVRNGGLRADDFPEIDVPFAQSPWPQSSMGVHTQGDPESATKSVAAAIHSVDPKVPLAGIRTMEQIVDETLRGDEFVAGLFGIFAGVAVLLTAVGIYGVMAFAVAQRTHEIGLRIALGASPQQVLRLLLGEGLLLAAVGSGLGLAGAIVAGRAMRGVLYQVGTVDLAAFSAVTGALFVAALVACYVPANRAAQVDPMVALRYE